MAGHVEENAGGPHQGGDHQDLGQGKDVESCSQGNGQQDQGPEEVGPDEHWLAGATIHEPPGGKAGEDRRAAGNSSEDAQPRGRGGQGGDSQDGQALTGNAGAEAGDGLGRPEAGEGRLAPERNLSGHGNLKR